MWYTTASGTDAAVAEAQSSESESDPVVKLWPPASRLGIKFWCQCKERFTRNRTQDWVCCFDYVECWKKFARVERLQLSRSTCNCLHASSFSYVFLTALSDFLDTTEYHLNVSRSNN